MILAFSSDKQRHYETAKKSLMDFLQKIEEPIGHATQLLNGSSDSSISNICQKLKEDRFSLVLIGAFQSGKSTLFNYLCDGRELSPVGPGGGGIRTSGCRVTAHSVPEGEEEYAVVTWRTPDELLRSLGNTLLPYYGNESGFPETDYLTEKLVNLHDESQRKLLADYAWEQLSDKSCSAEEKELLRFALLVCHFFPEFAEQCHQGATRHTMHEIVRLSSYPQSWKRMWTIVQESKDLSVFRGQVSFAFVAGLDLYLNSPRLRELGCSVTDCPGLFISKWDTMIAEKCIRESDAILYMFAGEKAMTQADLEALRACVEMGGTDKILFGSNLRTSEDNWQRIEEDDVLPTLRDNGFESPEIHPFHSGLALRAKELYQQKCDDLSEESAKGIDLDISLDKRFISTDSPKQNRLTFLEKKLNSFINTLSGGNEKLENYDIYDGQSLEMRSHVPNFVKAAKDFVVDYRYPSLLIYQGIDIVIRELNNTRTAAKTKAQWLSSDSEKLKLELEHLQTNLEKLRRNKEQACENIRNCITAQKPEILRHFNAILNQELVEKRKEIQELFMTNRPDGLRIIANKISKKLTHKEVFDLNKKCQKFARGLEDIFKSGLKKVRTEITEKFATLDAFNTIRSTFETERERLMDDISGLREIPNLQVMKVTLPQNWENASAKTVLPPDDELRRILIEGDSSVWSDALLVILTFGVGALFTSKEKYASEFYVKYAPQFESRFAGILEKAMAQNDAPFGVIESTLECFEKAFNAPLEQAEKMVQAAHEERQKADTPARHALIRQLTQACASLGVYIQEGETLKRQIATGMNI